MTLHHSNDIEFQVSAETQILEKAIDSEDVILVDNLEEDANAHDTCYRDEHENNELILNLTRSCVLQFVKIVFLVMNLERKEFKKLLDSVDRVSITTDMWTSIQNIHYMVVTCHFVDSNFDLHKIILSFVDVPPPYSGANIFDCLFKCLKDWNIEMKVATLTVDNARTNNVVARNLMVNVNSQKKLLLDGDLFHVRCCAHILNLLVQDGLSEIQGIIHSVRESVKHIEYDKKGVSIILAKDQCQPTEFYDLLNVYSEPNGLKIGQVAEYVHPTEMEYDKKCVSVILAKDQCQPTEFYDLLNVYSEPDGLKIGQVAEYVHPIEEIKQNVEELAAPRFEKEYVFGDLAKGESVVLENYRREEEDMLRYYKSWDHIIGGDLYAFQLTTGFQNNTLPSPVLSFSTLVSLFSFSPPPRDEVSTAVFFRHCRRRPPRFKSPQPSFSIAIQVSVNNPQLILNLTRSCVLQFVKIVFLVMNLERKEFKKLLDSVDRVSITTDMWTSIQNIHYMVVTCHFVDSNFDLHKIILSFVDVPPPYSGANIFDCLFKCLKDWNIEMKVATLTVDNARTNNVVARNLMVNVNSQKKLLLDGDLFHVRCCAHILNLLVQDGLSEIQGIIHSVRESVKHIEYDKKGVSIILAKDQCQPTEFYDLLNVYSEPNGLKIGQVAEYVHPTEMEYDKKCVSVILAKDQCQPTEFYDLLNVYSEPDGLKEIKQNVEELAAPRFEKEYVFGDLAKGESVVLENYRREEEDMLRYYKSWDHIIGGDLYAFQLTTGFQNNTLPSPVLSFSTLVSLFSFSPPPRDEVSTAVFFRHCRRRPPRFKSPQPSFSIAIQVSVNNPQLILNLTRSCVLQFVKIVFLVMNLERKEFKKLLDSVDRVSITTDMWTSIQNIHYMVVTCHFVDSNFDLHKIILSFVDVPPPYSGANIFDCLFKCLKDWNIEMKVATLTVDNARTNNVVARNLMVNVNSQKKLLLDGDLFHVRCCAHILNLLVQDGLSEIQGIIHSVRESVKHIEYDKKGVSIILAKDQCQPTEFYDLLNVYSEPNGLKIGQVAEYVHPTEMEYDKKCVSVILAKDQCQPTEFYDLLNVYSEPDGLKIGQVAEYVHPIEEIKQNVEELAAPRFEKEYVFGDLAKGESVVLENYRREEEDMLRYYKSWDHIIGGDLYAFQLTTGFQNNTLPSPVLSFSTLVSLFSFSPPPRDEVSTAVFFRHCRRRPPRFKSPQPSFSIAIQVSVNNPQIVFLVMNLERKEFKKLLDSVDRVSITTDMWTSIQNIHYMVVTCHFVDSNFDLHKIILSFVDVPPPYSGANIFDCLFKCLKDWNIEMKVATLTVDNARTNNVVARNLMVNVNSQKKLLLDGDLFHVRCCAHILNLLVQDGLSEIQGIIHSVRESVKHVCASPARLHTFTELTKQLKMKQKHLILDVTTRWNATYAMLSTALEFKAVFKNYADRETTYNTLPSDADWKKSRRCSEYPTSNLFLVELYAIKEALANVAKDENDCMKSMASKMKEKFDKYWGYSNLLISISAILDPRYKMKLINLSFNTICSVVDAQVEAKIVRDTLEILFNEYVKEHKESYVESSSASVGTRSETEASHSNFMTSRFGKGVKTGRDRYVCPTY
ncbi:hypothetical protein SSX86_030468 [Deinandra increscens subsp. villosa]|uniref:hAT-like transposase RNase-H fold domain-containing protein n=1 Tax=Deinandra increscens subsp. villosa TaxID=3103831 RepID=A0AAP0GJ73_9ASTR